MIRDTNITERLNDGQRGGRTTCHSADHALQCESKNPPEVI